MATRYFTLEQAQALLPRVRSLMGQALQLHGHLRKAIARLSDDGHEINWALLRGEEQLAAPDDELESDEGSDALERARMIYLALRESVAQIEALGAEVKGVMDGLVDFRSWRDGTHEVLLCFKLGEAEIQFYHGLDEGFDGRHPTAGHRFCAEFEGDAEPDRQTDPETNNEPDTEPGDKRSQSADTGERERVAGPQRQ
ncbi:hypothetical protein DB30_03996 [Enhygromyxa salina]|uniref:DUF2203 domain-containing protein n=1 Tax=Enhygromyxa salina TaxID=215803 RepID=A0A0C1ZGR7_9BACT|nr:DUF2203 domain-containing protein [Enhygromyxa salina]KIG16834.1 hypothetical protein DB30_03996 [Enhygromyxa salina]